MDRKHTKFDKNQQIEKYHPPSGVLHVSHNGTLPWGPPGFTVMPHKCSVDKTPYYHGAPLQITSSPCVLKPKLYRFVCHLYAILT